MIVGPPSLLEIPDGGNSLGVGSLERPNEESQVVASTRWISVMDGMAHIGVLAAQRAAGPGEELRQITERRTMREFTDAQELKFRLLATGLSISAEARSWLADVTHGKSLTSADYASTSGLILELDDDVWVNAPISDHNPNFVRVAPSVLRVDSDGLLVDGDGLSSRVRYWAQPDFHGTSNAVGPLNNYVVTHGDRARLSPLRGCAMTCTFCNIPYDDPIETYALKSISASVAAVQVALDDPAQPAYHVLISGGTPKPKDVGFHRELYRTILTSFPSTKVDIMMAPIKDVLDLPELATLGVNELSINLEVFSRDRTREVAQQKYNQGREYYLDFIEDATRALGPGKVRSMLLVGLEPMESTLAGVAAIAERGGVPVLSPFRPDPVTPLRDTPPPTATQLREVFLRASEIVDASGTILGPDCPPCSHNTLNFAAGFDGLVSYPYPRPVMR